MRIEAQSTFSSDRLQKNMVDNKTTDSFAGIMKNSQSKLQLDSLNHLMNRVDAGGQKLANQRTLENLVNYKKLVKQFISESVNYGLQLSEKQSFQYNGGMKSHQLVEVIDEKLIEINDEVLDNEKDNIDTLRLVGEIKGLLINLYM